MTRSFRTAVAFSHDMLAGWARISAKHSEGAHAFVVSHAAFPRGGEHIRIAEQVLLERRGEGEDWMMIWDSFESFLGYMKCPIRIELYEGVKGRDDYFKILIPPDSAKPRATRWRTLFTGDLTDEVESFFHDSCRGVCDVRTVKPKKPVRVIFRGERGKK